MVEPNFPADRIPPRQFSPSCQRLLACHSATVLTLGDDDMTMQENIENLTSGAARALLALIGEKVPPPRPPCPIDQRPAKVHDKPMLIFKILTRPEWDAFRSAGATQGAGIDIADGFIHFSTAAQVAETAAKHFANQSDLVLLAVHSTPLGPDLKWEVSRGGQLFPHLYRPLQRADILWDKSLPLGASGHIFPEGLW